MSRVDFKNKTPRFEISDLQNMGLGKRMLFVVYRFVILPLSYYNLDLSLEHVLFVYDKKKHVQVI